MAPLTMNVSGNATLSRTAERAVIDFEVSLTGKTQEETSKQVTDTAQKLQVMLKPLGPVNNSEEAKASSAITRWTMASLRTSSYTTPKKKGDPQIDYSASVDFNIRVRDFEKLGMLASKLSQMPLVKLQGVNWVLTDNTIQSLTSELRKMTAADALARAKDYAEPLGLDKILPLELHESHPAYVHPSAEYYYARAIAGKIPRGTNMAQRPGVTGMAQRQVYTDAHDQEAQSFENLFFEPEEISMSAGVTCKFSAELSSETDKNKKRKLSVVSKGMEDSEMD